MTGRKIAVIGGGIIVTLGGRSDVDPSRVIAVVAAARALGGVW